MVFQLRIIVMEDMASARKRSRETDDSDNPVHVKTLKLDELGDLGLENLFMAPGSTNESCKSSLLKFPVQTFAIELR